MKVYETLSKRDYGIVQMTNPNVFLKEKMCFSSITILNNSNRLRHVRKELIDSGAILAT